MSARLVLIAMMLMMAVFAGTLAGNATVTGMNGLGEGSTPPSIGDERAVLAGLPADPTAWTPPAARAPGFALAAAAAPVERPDCLDCSDYEAGYRWAAAHEVENMDACDGDSDAFADGCAAYVGDGARAS